MKLSLRSWLIFVTIFCIVLANIEVHVYTGTQDYYLFTVHTVAPDSFYLSGSYAKGTVSIWIKWPGIRTTSHLTF